MNEIVSFLRTLFEGLNSTRRRIAIVAVLIFVVVAAYGVEYFTGYVYYRSLERKVALLKDLQSLMKEGIDGNADLYPVYQLTVKELASRDVRPLATPAIAIVNTVEFWKGFTGALPWILFAVMALFGTFGETNKIVGIIGVSVIAVMVGGVSALVPTIYNPWVNYLVVPSVQIVAISFFGSRMRRSKPAP